MNKPFGRQWAWNIIYEMKWNIIVFKNVLTYDTCFSYIYRFGVFVVQNKE